MFQKLLLILKKLLNYWYVGTLFHIKPVGYIFINSCTNLCVLLGNTLPRTYILVYVMHIMVVVFFFFRLMGFMWLYSGETNGNFSSFAVSLNLVKAWMWALSYLNPHFSANIVIVRSMWILNKILIRFETRLSCFGSA